MRQQQKYSGGGIAEAVQQGQCGGGSIRQGELS